LTQHFEELAKYGARRAGWGNPSREKFDELRGWIQAVDPPSADRATGLALQMYLEQSKTAEIQNFVEKVALDYHLSLTGSCGHQTPKLQVHPHEQQDYHQRSRCFPYWETL
jgi:hypothetical protein